MGSRRNQNPRFVPVTPQEVGETFSFVIHELIRLQKLGRDVVKTLKGLDVFCSIYDAERRMRFIGRPAYERLRDLTIRIVDQSPYRGRLEIDRTFGCVRTGFGRDYIRADFRATSDEEDLQTLLRWLDEAAAECRDLTHFVPCQVRLPPNEQFIVGPVTLEPAQPALERLRADLARETAPTCDDENWRASENERALAYLTAFTDLASVPVPGCDPDTSRSVAEEAVQAALAFLHVMAGAEHTNKIRTGGPAIPNAQRSTLALDQNGKSFMTWVGDWEGARLTGKFWDWLRREEQQRLATAAGTAIQFIVDRADPPMMAARYLDAAAWYSDAATEARRPAAILKYLTAMERLLWTGEGGGVTHRLASRAAALCFVTDPWNFEELRGDIRRAYNLRSEIAHGRVRSDDPKIGRNYWRCERICRDLLTTWLFRYGDAFHRQTTLEKLRAHLDGFVAEVETEAIRRKESPPCATNPAPDQSGLS